MAEIKSAIELAMEKTRGLVMDEKEKKSMALKELAEDVRTIYRRYREGLNDEDETRSQLDVLECDEDFKKKIVLDLLLEESEATDDIRDLGRLFSFTGFVIDEKAYGELRHIERACLAELDRLKAGMRSKIAADLAASGISGDSVEPNVEGWPRWHEASSEVRHAFVEHVRTWKEKLNLS